MPKNIRPASEVSFEETIEAYNEHGGYRTAAAALQLHPTTVRRRIAIARDRGLVPPASQKMSAASPPLDPPEDGSERRVDETNEKTGTRKIDLVTHEQLTTLEEVLEYCEVDLSVWFVKKHRITSHKQGQSDTDKNPRIVSMVNISLELELLKPDDPRAAKDDVLAMLRSHAPRVPAVRTPRRSRSSGVCVVSSIPDIHFGKHADREETGDDYDLDIARALYLEAKRDMLERVSARYDKIDLIVDLPANDLLHFTGTNYTTTNGTRQDAAARWKRTYRVARETAVDGVLMEREVAPVKVISIEDNHARAESFYIGDAIDCYFHKDKRVEVDSGAASQKFHRFGNVLLGLHHGDTMKMDQLVGSMVHWVPKDFAECSYREWLLGHLHKEMLIDNDFGMFARRLPSLSGVDAWHAMSGYYNTKSAMTLVYNDRCLEDILYFTPGEEVYVS